jgi:uncharacterized membrane protein (DUF106 family)
MRLSLMDTNAVRVRIKELQAEIKKLQREASLEMRSLHHTPNDMLAHERRLIRMKNLIDELAKLKR